MISGWGGGGGEHFLFQQDDEWNGVINTHDTSIRATTPQEKKTERRRRLRPPTVAEWGLFRINCSNNNECRCSRSPEYDDDCALLTNFSVILLNHLYIQSRVLGNLLFAPCVFIKFYFCVNCRQKTDNNQVSESKVIAPDLDSKCIGKG